MKRYEIMWTEYAESTCGNSFYTSARSEAEAISKFRKAHPNGVIWKVC